MPVRAVCPECGETAVLSNGLPGDLVNCKQCGLEFPIPDAPKPPPLRKPKRPPPLVPPKPKVVGSEDPTPYASPGELDEPMLPPAGMSYGADEPELPPAKAKKKPRPAVNDERFELAPSTDRPSTPQSLPAFDDEPTIPTGKQSYGQDIRESDNAIPLAKGYGSHNDYDDDEPALPSSSRSFGQDLDDDPVIPLAKEGYGRDDDHAAIPLAKDGFGLHSYEDEEEEEKPLPPPKTPAFIPKLDDEPALPSVGNSYGRDLDDNEPELPALPPLPPPIPGGKRSNRRDVEDDEPAIPSSRKAYGRDEEEDDDRPSRRSSRNRRQFDDEDDYEPRQKSKPSKGTLLVAIGLIGMLMLSAGGITAYLLLGDDGEESNNNTVANNDPNSNIPPFVRPNPKKGNLPDFPISMTTPYEKELPGTVEDVVVAGDGPEIGLKIKNQFFMIAPRGDFKLSPPITISENTIITAGSEHFFLYDPQTNKITVRSLIDRGFGAKEDDVGKIVLEATSPFDQPIVAFSQGSSSSGPILCAVGGDAGINLHLLDPVSLKPITIQAEKPLPVLKGHLRLRASAIGRRWTIQEKEPGSSSKTIFLQMEADGTVTWIDKRIDAPYVLYGTDGVSICAKGLYPTVEAVPEKPSDSNYYLPSISGWAFLRVTPNASSNKNTPDMVSIIARDGTEIDRFNQIPTPTLKADRYLSLDQQVMLFPMNGANDAVITIDNVRHKFTYCPHTFYRTDSKEFSPFIKSNPPPAFQPGQSLSFRAEVVAPENKYTLTLENPLPGMSFTKREFRWDNPSEDAPNPTEVRISLATAAKQYPPIVWRIYNPNAGSRLATIPKNPPKVTPITPIPVPKKEPQYAEGATLVVKAPQARPITPCSSDQAKWDVVTPGQIEDVCVAGGGRFLVLNCADVGKVAIFDTTQGKIVGTLPVKAENVLVAGSMDHVVVVYPDTNTIERWNLDKLEREAEGKFTSRQKVSAIVMGNAGAGPIILGGPQAQNNASKMSLMFLDLASLKEVRIDQVDGNHGVSFGSRAHLRASNDGSLLGAWYDALDPTGLQIVRLQGNSIHGEYVRDSVGYVHPTSSRIYTSKGMYDLKGQPTGKREAVIPAVQGEGYVTVTDIENGGKLISVFQGNDDKPTDAFDTLPGFDGRKDPFERDQAIRFWDKRLFLIPGAKILVGIPPQADRLRVVKLK